MKAVVQLTDKPDAVFNAPFIVTQVDGDGDLTITCYGDADPPERSITELAQYARDKWDSVRLVDFPTGEQELDMWHERQFPDRPRRRR